MYKIEKRFTLPIGHRLSKHEGRCFSIHGHNFVVLIGVKSKTLDGHDMLIDFSNLKAVVHGFLDIFDHCLVLNECDKGIADHLKELGMRTQVLDHDPTAEKFSEIIYKEVERTLCKMYPDIMMDYVTVYENENSKATYSED